ncbi:MAG: ketopantoate reductase family protein [Gaiellaceae bacterium]
MSEPTIAVLGPGAVGGTLAIRLGGAGLRVICVATPGTADAIARDGLRLTWLGREIRQRPEVVTRLEEPVSLLLVTVKSVALADALQRLDPALLQDAVVLPLLNGLEHLEPIRAAVGPRVAAGSISISVHLEAPGRVVQTTDFTIVRMASADLDREQLNAAASFLHRAGVDARVKASEAVVLWEKAARLAPLAAATAAAGRTVGEIRSNPDWWERLRNAVSEACAVAGAYGVVISPETEWKLIAALPPEMTTSSARDVAAGHPSELDAIAGAVIRAGERLGLSCPWLTGLLAEAQTAAGVV